jgi:P-type Cu2+ transporter
MLQLSRQSNSANSTNQTTANLSTQTATLDVTGMKCAGCVKAVERQLLKNEGIISARVNLITEVAVVEYRMGSIVPKILAEKLTENGFPSQLRDSQSSQNYLTKIGERRRQEGRQQRQQLIIAFLLLFFSSLGHLQHLGWGSVSFLGNIWFHWGLATLALLVPGREILLDGGRNLWQRHPNMNSLIGLGTFTAYLTSCLALFFPQLGWECFFDEPVMLLGFIFLGRVLEQRARRKASAALEALLALQPQVARLTTQNSPAEAGIEIPVDRVRVGEWVRVLIGEKIPVDGEVVAGETSVNESMLTGESTSVTKIIGSLVTAGTLNQTGVIAVRVSRVGADTTLAQIIRLVEEAQTRKAPIQQLADTISGYFAYGVMAFALITFFFWYLIGTKLYPDVAIVAEMAHHSHHVLTTMVVKMGLDSELLLSLKLAIATLVVACPCALGLATPTAILVGTSIGAERGILIKGGDVLEKVQKLDAVVFDKTGTLTLGNPQVTDCVVVGKISETRLLEIAAAVANNSNHPLAKAIVRHARSKALLLPEITDFSQKNGLGTSAMVEGKRVDLGSWEYLREWGVKSGEVRGGNRRQSEARYEGKTLVYVAIDGISSGIIALEDELRPDALTTVQKLQQMGLRVLLVSGDRLEVVAATAAKVGIEEFWAQQKPAEKAAIVEFLQKQGKGKTVAVVGDGINDAPALAKADLGISLLGGTDVAIETADIVLMSCQNLEQNGVDRAVKLLDIVKTIELSRATVGKIRQNLIWAFAYNLFALPLAAGAFLPQFGILLSPSIASLLMISSSSIVVFNSLSLLRKNIS